MKVILSFILVFCLNSCFLFGDKTPKPDDPIVVKDPLPEFNTNPIEYKTEVGKTDEASGIVPSKSFQNSLWVIEDGNNVPGLHLVGTDGKYKKFVKFAGRNRDWEDLAIGPGPEANLNYLYVPDIGDNFEKYGEYQIFRFPEPTNNQTDIVNFDTFSFTYPNKVSYDSETLLLDPKTKDLYIITKLQFNVKVFRLKYPQSTNQTTEAEFLGDIPYSGIVGGDISSNGDEILLKNYLAVYYWKIKKDETVFNTLKRLRDIGAPYFQEPQGESICWSSDAKGYYTISELGASNISSSLFYYSKK